MSTEKWEVLGSIVTIENPWMKLIGERLLDEEGRELDYWRIDRADSIIIIPIQSNDIVLPRRFYRPGIQELSYDFPGGRLEKGLSASEAALRILTRELDIDRPEVESLAPLCENGWAVDSSFSSQRVFPFRAYIKAEVSFSPKTIGIREPVNQAGVKRILDKLSCLQCRCTLLEWMRSMDDSL